MKLLIDSSNRTSISSSNTDFTLHFSKPINNVKKVKLLHATIPNTFYTVNSSNQSIDFKEGGGPELYATITNGMYDISNLLSAIKTAMDDAPGSDSTYTATYSSITGFITISATGNFSLIFSSNGTNYSTSLATLLGFDKSDSTDATSATGTKIPQISRPYHFDIVIAEFPNEISTSADNYLSFIIPVDVDSGSVITWNDEFEQVINFGSPKNLSTLNIRLQRNGSTIDLNGAEWIMLLEFN